MVYHNLEKFGDRKHYDYGVLIFNCHVILCDHLFKGLYDFLGGNPSW